MSNYRSYYILACPDLYFPENAIMHSKLNLRFRQWLKKSHKAKMEVMGAKGLIPLILEL